MTTEVFWNTYKRRKKGIINVPENFMKKATTMTKEQKEAIEILKEFKDKGYAKLYIKYNGNRSEINLKIKNSIETVLSMLEEKDNKIRQLGKGQQTLIQSRRKWKNRYYKMKKGTNI